MTTPQTSERAAAERIGAVIFKHLDAHGTFTDQFKSEVGAKCLAHRGFLTTVFREYEADPGRIGERDVLLKQQPTATLDRYDWLLERAAEKQQEWADLCAEAETLRRERVAEFRADARGEREDDERISRERADADAAAGMPKGIAS